MMSIEISYRHIYRHNRHGILNFKPKINLFIDIFLAPIDIEMDSIDIFLAPIDIKKGSIDIILRSIDITILY